MHFAPSRQLAAAALLLALPLLAGAKPVFALTQGAMQCKDKATLELHAMDTDTIALRWHGRDYRLRRQSSAAGAWHFEDAGSGLVLVQIPAKTMLLDHKRMTRLADECTPGPQLASR